MATTSTPNRPWAPHALPAMVRHEVDVLRAHLAANASIMAPAAKTNPGLVAELEEAQAEIEATINEIAAMTLHWFTPDMAALAMDLSEDYSPATPLPELVPSATGILIWDGGIGQWPRLISDPINNPWRSQGPIPVDGIRWHTTPTGMRLAPLFRTSQLQWHQHHITVTPAFTKAFKRQQASALAFNASRFPWPPTTTPPVHVQGLAQAFWASLILIDQGQDQLTSVQPVTATIRHSHAGHGKKPGTTQTKTVHVIDMLHRPQQPADHKPSQPTDGGRQHWHLTHRHLVRAHIRNQAYGPGRTLRKPVLIPPHIKGPHDAPFITQHRVHLWRTPDQP